MTALVVNARAKTSGVCLARWGCCRRVRHGLRVDSTSQQFVGVSSLHWNAPLNGLDPDSPFNLKTLSVNISFVVAISSPQIHTCRCALVRYRYDHHLCWLGAFAILAWGASSGCPFADKTSILCVSFANMCSLQHHQLTTDACFRSLYLAYSSVYWVSGCWRSGWRRRLVVHHCTGIF